MSDLTIIDVQGLTFTHSPMDANFTTAPISLSEYRSLPVGFFKSLWDAGINAKLEVIDGTGNERIVFPAAQADKLQNVVPYAEGENLTPRALYNGGWSHGRDGKWARFATDEEALTAAETLKEFGVDAKVDGTKVYFEPTEVNEANFKQMKGVQALSPVDKRSALAQQPPVAETNIHQVKTNELIKGLPEAIAAGDDAVVKWVGEFAENSAYTNISYDKQQVLNQLKGKYGDIPVCSDAELAAGGRQMQAKQIIRGAMEGLEKYGAMHQITTILSNRYIAEVPVQLASVENPPTGATQPTVSQSTLNNPPQPPVVEPAEGKPPAGKIGKAGIGGGLAVGEFVGAVLDPNMAKNQLDSPITTIGNMAISTVKEPFLLAHDIFAPIVVGADKLTKGTVKTFGGEYKSTITPQQEKEALTPASGIVNTFNAVALPNDGFSYEDRQMKRAGNLLSNLFEITDRLTLFNETNDVGKRIAKYFTGDTQTPPLPTQTDGKPNEIKR